MVLPILCANFASTASKVPRPAIHSSSMDGSGIARNIAAVTKASTANPPEIQVKKPTIPLSDLHINSPLVMIIAVIRTAPITTYSTMSSEISIVVQEKIRFALPKI